MIWKRGYWINVSNSCTWDINTISPAPPLEDFIVKDEHALPNMPKIPYILWGNIEINRNEASDTNSFLVLLKSAGITYSSYQSSEKGFYMLEVPSEIEELELVVSVNGKEIKVSQVPPGNPGEVIRHDISLNLTPKESKLYQNYPNSFNSETWIPYQLAKDAKVTIRICSLTGQLIKLLDLGYKEAGSYTTK